VVEANLLNLNQEFRLFYLDDLIAYKLNAAEQAGLDIVNSLGPEFHGREYQRLRPSETYPKNIVIYTLAGLEFKDIFHRLGLAAKFCALSIVPGKLPGRVIDYLITWNRAGNQSILSGRNI
jgi:hypothetical protein